MCGIFCSVCISNQADNYCHDAAIINSLQRRGPDYSRFTEFQQQSSNFYFYACILHMQGKTMMVQPAISSNGSILLYNGEIFSGLQVPADKSDTAVLLNLLNECNESADFISILESIEGPWSFVFYQKSVNKLWFGRDYFGRRSLLISILPYCIQISSVSKRSNGEWCEVSPGLHCIDCNIQEKLNVDVSYSWTSITNEPHSDLLVSNFENSLKKPCLTSPVRKYIIRKHAAVDLEAYNESITNYSLLKQLVSACDSKNIWQHCRKLINALENAVLPRTKMLTIWKQDSKVGVLFSGGIDCTVLALLIDRCLPANEPIDLLNVAFEQEKSNSKTNEANFNVPDRVTGLGSYEELRRLCPNRRWKFVEINVTVEKLRKLRVERVADLTYPKQTVLDDSIACALWFASRGKGLLKHPDGIKRKYQSPVKILFCGLGADEQLGGYSRHRTVFHKTGDWNAVDGEIRIDIERISSRNLGRDDRVVSDHGREGRYPYLDEKVVGFLSSLPVQDKADLRYPRGVGEKILLRGAAYLLGLHEAAVLPKRAIQFGSRVAKAEAAREKGSDTCTRLLR